MVVLTPLSLEHCFTKSSEIEQRAKHYTFSLPHDLIHIYSMCTLEDFHLPQTYHAILNRLKMMLILFEINFSYTIMLQILCLPISV